MVKVNFILLNKKIIYNVTRFNIAKADALLLFFLSIGSSLLHIVYAYYRSSV